MNKPQLRLPLQEFDSPLPEQKAWRPIHYLGSKLRMIEPIRLALDQVNPHGGAVCDLFAGSGTVSAALSSSREVVAVDIQEYSRVLCSAVLCPALISDAEARNFLALAFGNEHQERLASASPLIDYEQHCLNKAREGDGEPICELIEHASMVAFHSKAQVPVIGALERAQKQTWTQITGQDKRHTVTLRYFGGLYFSYLQAVQLDSLLVAAQAVERSRRDSFLAAIISTASEVVNTVGKHFAQPIRPRGADGKPKRHLVGKILRDRELDVASQFALWLDRYRSLPQTGRSHQVIRADFAETLAQLGTRLGAVYADPPYTRDHYSRFYHVLETMCLWDDPGVSTTRIRADSAQFSRGMYRTDRHQSPFCIKSQAPAAFERLFAAVHDAAVPLVLSYSPYAVDGNAHPRVMTVEQITSLATKYFTSVKTISAGRISHMKLNATRLHIDASAEGELIFLCT